MNLSNGRLSDNVLDIRGLNMGDWIDANNMYWSPYTDSYNMFLGIPSSD